jgi:hypothetical protein
MAQTEAIQPSRVSEGSMNKKPTGATGLGRTATTVTTETTRTLTRQQVRDALARGATRLPSDEEKALRMLHGGSAPRTLVLERVGQDHPDTREKLLGIELELLRQWRERQAAQKPEPRLQAAAAPRPAAPVAANPKRERIVAALKTKKPARDR